MKRSLVVLVSMLFACSVFGQDAAQTVKESTVSFLSMQITPQLSIPTGMITGWNKGREIALGPAVGVSTKYRFPPIPWLFASLEMLFEYNTFSHSSFSGSVNSLGGFAQLGVLFDIGPAFSIGASAGPGYAVTSVSSDDPDPMESGSGFAARGEIFGWLMIAPSWSLGAEIAAYGMPGSDSTRFGFGIDAGYHFLDRPAPAAPEAAPQPATPQPTNPEPVLPRKPSWLSLGVGASGGYFSDAETFSVGPNEGTVTLAYVPFSIFGFVDATYVEASVGYMFYDGASLKLEATGFPTDTTDYKEKAGWLSIAALFKYPFKLGTFTWFPLAGIEYDINLTYTDADGNDFKSGMTSDEKANLDQLWIKAGVGADFTFGNIYIRPRILAGYKFLSKLEKDAISSLKSAGADSADTYPLTISGGLLIGYKL